WIISKNKILYSDLYAVEIRKRNEPRQNPYVIFHFTKKQSKFIFFSNRAFMFKNVKLLIPLIECLVNNEVLIILNFTSDYSQEKGFLKTYIEEKRGIVISC